MRYIIYGAGGVGGVIGARLHQNGHDVILIARGAHLEAIQHNGLKFESPLEKVVLNIPAVSHPREIQFREDDAVLFTMKTQHTAAALDDLRATAGDQIGVICCQNGVANERMAARRFQRVYGMVVYLPATYLEPGLVQSHSKAKSGLLDAGCYPNGTDSFIENVTAGLRESNFAAEPTSAIMRWKYTKLLMNLNNSLQALCGEDLSDARALMKRLREEAIACYKTAGIDYATLDEMKSRNSGIIEYAPIDGEKHRGGGSSWQSMMRGTGDIETDYLNGEISQLGRLHGVPTPTNNLLQGMTAELIIQGGKPGDVMIDEILERVGM